MPFCITPQLVLQNEDSPAFAFIMRVFAVIQIQLLGHPKYSMRKAIFDLYGLRDEEKKIIIGDKGKKKPGFIHQHLKLGEELPGLLGQKYKK